MKELRAKAEIPRIAEGKYLKLLYKLHDKCGTLNVDQDFFFSNICTAGQPISRCLQNLQASCPPHKRVAKEAQHEQGNDQDENKNAKLLEQQHYVRENRDYKNQEIQDNILPRDLFP